MSGDAGGSWIGANPVPELPEGADSCYAPEVAFDKDGVLYYLFVGLAGAGNRPMGAYLTLTADRGLSFSAPQRVLGALKFGVRMLLDPDIGHHGRLHLVWVDARSDVGLGGFGAPPNPVLAAFSDDQGRSFSEPVEVSDTAQRRVVAPAVALGEDHHLQILFYDLGDDARDYAGLEGPRWDGTWTLVLATLDVQGRRLRTSVVDADIVPSERVMLIFTMPAASIAATGRTVCVAWTDARHGDPDILTRCSDSDGRRWRRVQRVNDDGLDTGIRQYLPKVSFGPAGRLDIIFYDRRSDPENSHNDLWFSYSRDGGRTFYPASRVTRVSSDARIGQRYAGRAAQQQIEVGGRLGLLSTGNGAIAAWTDARNSNNASTGQDAMTARVHIGRAEASSARQFSIGATLVWLGAITSGMWFGVARRRRRDALHRQRALVRFGRPWRAASAASLVYALTSCTSTSQTSAPPVAKPHILDVVMREHRFEYDPEIPAGRVVFRVHNDGHLDHELVLFPVDEDFPPINIQLLGNERRPIYPIAGIPVQKPGDTGTFAVELTEGRRYAMACFVRDADGQHDQKGMNSEFRALRNTEGGRG
ncbi:MAG TPA: sialidase family protein [Mycobacterium sp.]|nr:sialidase family protein [Mycobacterium sp.]